MLGDAVEVLGRYIVKSMCKGREVIWFVKSELTAQGYISVESTIEGLPELVPRHSRTAKYQDFHILIIIL